MLPLMRQVVISQMLNNLPLSLFLLTVAPPLYPSPSSSSRWDHPSPLLPPPPHGGTTPLPFSLFLLMVGPPLFPPPPHGGTTPLPFSLFLLKVGPPLSPLPLPTHGGTTPLPSSLLLHTVGPPLSPPPSSSSRWHQLSKGLKKYPRGKSDY